MTDKKISDLGANGTLAGTEYVELVQSGGNVKALLSAIKTFSNKGESIILGLAMLLYRQSILLCTLTNQQPLTVGSIFLRGNKWLK